MCICVYIHMHKCAYMFFLCVYIYIYEIVYLNRMFIMDKNTDISLFEMFLFHAQLFGTFLNLHCNPFVKIELGIQEIWRRHSFGGGKYVKIDMLGPAVDVLHSTSVWLVLLHDHIYIIYILYYVNIIYIIVWYCLRTFAVKMVTPWRIQLFYQSIMEAWTCGMFHSCLDLWNVS